MSGHGAHKRRAGAQAFTLRAWLAGLGEGERRAEALAAVWALMADGTLRPYSGTVLVAGSGASRGCAAKWHLEAGVPLMNTGHEHCTLICCQLHPMLLCGMKGPITCKHMLFRGTSYLESTGECMRRVHWRMQKCGK